jgi:hypothetical protein
MALNIPLEKLDNPKMRKFLTTYVKGGGDIPEANWLHESYVQKVYSIQQECVKGDMSGMKVAVLADETTDVAGRYVVNILLQPLDAFDKN